MDLKIASNLILAPINLIQNSCIQDFWVVGDIISLSAARCILK